MTENKDIAFNIIGWSDDSTKIYFSERKYLGPGEDGCPNLSHSDQSQGYTIDINTKKVSKKGTEDQLYQQVSR
jgi:hypothetical protein